MRKIYGLILVAAAVVGGYLFLNKYSIEGLDGIKLIEKQHDPSAVAASSTGSPFEPIDRVAEASPLTVSRTGDTVRIATFNLQVFGSAKLSKPHVIDIIARICRRFDVIAVQEIRSLDQSVLPQLVDAVNATGRNYDYAIGPRLGRTHSKEQYAFIFDRGSVELDRTQLHTINDPQDMLHREPLVGWFRVRGPAPDQAFTFSLVNVHTDPDEVDREMAVMDDVLHSVRNDGRDEDDVILIGDFNTDDRHIGELASVVGITPAVQGAPTNTRGTRQLDNLYFQHHATTEFVGRSGVFDFLREYNLSIAEALEVSDHLPVWAEFSVYEGGEPGRTASL